MRWFENSRRCRDPCLHSGDFGHAAEAERREMDAHGRAISECGTRPIR